MMAESLITRHATRSRASRCAHVIERLGLAMAGASCGLFVATHIASTRVEAFGSVALVLFLMMLGAIGFYLGIDIPPHRTGRATILPSGDSALPTDPVELLSSAGTFLAALAALLSVFSIVFDAAPALTWSLFLGACWLFGALLQIAAGASARIWRT